ncbi:MAG: nuclear transport factor 2 family protein [Candidatus Korobacteraceae bacterium]
MKSKSMFLLAVLLTAITFVSTAFPQMTQKSEMQKSGSGAVAEVTRLEQESVKADLKNDSSFAKEYYAEDFTSGSSWGTWDTKASVLKDMMDMQANKTNKEEMSDLKVRAYGNTAIATFTETYDSLYHGEHRMRTVMCTDTWVKQGTWKLVAGHCSQLAK